MKLCKLLCGYGLLCYDRSNKNYFEGQCISHLVNFFMCHKFSRLCYLDTVFYTLDNLHAVFYTLRYLDTIFYTLGYLNTVFYTLCYLDTVFFTLHTYRILYTTLTTYSCLTDYTAYNLHFAHYTSQ